MNEFNHPFLQVQRIGFHARQLISLCRRFQKHSSGLSDLEQLVSRELEILKELSEGYRCKEIADHLKIGMETVRTHFPHIHEKLHMEPRTEAVVGFVQLPSVDKRAGE